MTRPTENSYILWITDRMERTVILDALEGPLRERIESETANQPATNSDQHTARPVEMTATDLHTLRLCLYDDWVSRWHLYGGRGGGPTTVWMITDAIIGHIDALLDSEPDWSVA